MDILVIGSGGREHAVIKKLKESRSVGRIFCAPGNGGIARDAKCLPIKANDIDGVLKFSKANNIGYVVVTPDDPLVLGMVDALEAEGIRSFGPRKNAAAIEGSKVFAKELMKKYNIPTSYYEVFGSSIDAIRYLKSKNIYPTVIKADGLALGKGVVIAADFKEAEAAINIIMEDKIFGKSGDRVVIEEFLTGPEVSVLAFTDSKIVVPMVSSKDHKRAFDGDKGPNTGGMGTISPNPYYTEEIASMCMRNIFLPTIMAMNNEGRPFKGCLYFGLMLTQNGPKVIEYNARFGDPETQVVLPRLKSDLLEIFEAVTDERLSEISIEWDDGAAACVVAASSGYPGKYQTDFEITGLDEAEKMPDITVFHAGTRCEGKRLYTAGGRVLGVTALGENLEMALEKAYDAVKLIHFEGIHYRSDIGK